MSPTLPRSKKYDQHKVSKYYKKAQKETNVAHISGYKKHRRNRGYSII